MVSAVLTRYEAPRRPAVQALLGLGLVLPAIAFATFWLYDSDFAGSVSGTAVLVFCLAMAGVETLVFAAAAVLSAEMLGELGRACDEHYRLAYMDPLTGLLNRRGFDKAAVEILAAPDGRGRPAAALMCDLDHFKAINDEFGHGFGDEALRHFADVLRAASADRNIILGRMGAEEFLLLLVNFTPEDALAFAETLRLAVASRPVEWDGVKARITTSVGFASTPSSDGRVAPLIVRADAAVYEAKSNGRNRVAVAVDTDRPYVVGRT